MQYFNIVMTSLQQGLCYALVALGVYISYKILEFPDLSVDGTFPLGGVVSVILIKAGFPVFAALAAALLSGGLAGFVTGILHVKFKISNLLSGILVMTALISVTLNLTAVGNPNGTINVLIGYSGSNTLFNGWFAELFGAKYRNAGKVIVLVLLVAFFKVILDIFLKTKTGFMLRAAGNNEQLVTAMGRDSGTYKIMGLAVANAVVAFAGAVYSQQMNYYDNTSGVGMVVIALASVIIGCTILRRAAFIKGTTGAITGAIIYSACLSAAVYMGIQTTYLKLIMAGLFMLVLILNNRLGKNRGTHTLMRRGL